MNQADKESIRKGMSPNTSPPLNMNSIGWSVKAWTARSDVTKALNATNSTASVDFFDGEEKGITQQASTEKKIVQNKKNPSSIPLLS